MPSATGFHVSVGLFPKQMASIYASPWNVTTRQSCVTQISINNKNTFWPHAYAQPQPKNTTLYSSYAQPWYLQARPRHATYIFIINKVKRLLGGERRPHIRSFLFLMTRDEAHSLHQAAAHPPQSARASPICPCIAPSQGPFPFGIPDSSYWPQIFKVYAKNMPDFWVEKLWAIIHTDTQCRSTEDQLFITVTLKTKPTQLPGV